MEIKIDLEVLQKRKLVIATPMYGGQCAGMFAKSIADLTALCAKHNIPMQLHFLFNESLITRARNYCCDYFMRADGDHLMFIDSDIGFNPQDVIAMMALQAQDEEKYDIIGGAYPKKCLHHSAKVLTDKGFKPISWIVKNKYNGNVVSYDSLGNKVLSKITNHWSEPNKFKKWVSLRTSSVRSRDLLTVTSDHEVAYVNNVFKPKIEFIRADNMVGKYLVVNPTKNSNRRFNALYNEKQLSALIGSALGDGCVSDGSFVCAHGPKQKEYVKHKSKIFNANLSKNGLRFSIKNGQTIELSKLISKGKTKTLKNVIDNIDEIALAYMYMDDGNYYNYASRAEENGYDNWWFDLDTGKTKRSSSKPEGNWIVGRKETLSKGTSSIATMSFSIEDNELLSKHLKEKFDIDSEIHFQSPNKYGKKYPFICFDQKNTEKLHNLIKSYIHPSMEYKLMDEFKGCDKNEINSKPLDYGTVIVDHVVEPNDKNNSYLYDIEVENTHNFIANDVLVHNCISWEKIKNAVDKGIADNDPNILERFVGDFVFNPKTSQASIPIGEPVEVLEIGTGFMMITKNAMKKYQEAFPQYMYRPDHVRTKEFDGSRKIMQFFQAEIDPKSERYLSEDYWFCQKSQEIGLKTWLCPWMQLQHVGTYIFGGSLADLASIGVAATADPDKLGGKK